MKNRTEQKTKRSLISKRNFLKFLVSLPPAAALTYLTTKAGIYVPEYKEDENVISFPNPGWLETSVKNRPAFISNDEGHADFLMHMLTHNPVLIKSFTKAHKDFFDADLENIATIFQKNINAASSILKNEFDIKFTNLSENEQLQQQIHVAIYTTAGLISPYLTYNMVRKLNQENGFKLISEWKNGHPMHEMPTIYPTHNSNCDGELDELHRCKGHDRGIHFTQHFFMTYMYVYSTRAKTQDAYRIPNAAKVVLKPIIGLYNKARKLSYMAGLAWEWVETFEQEVTKRSEEKEGSTIPSGALDPHVSLDYKANEFGSISAIELFHLIFVENKTDLSDFWDNIEKEVSTVVEL